MHVVTKIALKEIKDGKAIIAVTTKDNKDSFRFHGTFTLTDKNELVLMPIRQSIYQSDARRKKHASNRNRSNRPTNPQTHRNDGARRRSDTGVRGNNNQAQTQVSA